MSANSPGAPQRSMGPQCIIKEGQQWGGKVKHGLLGTVYLGPEHAIRHLSSAKLQPQWRLLNKTEDLCWRLLRQLLEKDSCPQSPSGCNLYPEEVGEPSRCRHQNQAKG